MSEILLLPERVRHTITLGESHFREFKSALEGTEDKKSPRKTSAICKDIAEALVAFANADGGELLIGVEDHGAITGVPHSDPEIGKMLNAPKTHVHPDAVLPIVKAESLQLEEKTILFFSVTKGTTEVYQLVDGRCVTRKDRATVPANPKKIQFERQEVRSREYDRQFVDGASVTDLDIGYLQILANGYLPGLSVERYLQQLGIAEYASNGLRLRMAALLLFARGIQRWHPRSQVRILKVTGTELRSGDAYNVTSDEQVQGNISELLVSSWEKLRPFLAYKTEMGTDARFVQKYIYPEGACREALINAIAHRDYSIQNGIDVFIFDNRMEIRSPGSLLSTLDIAELEALEGAHESRNALVARVLRDNQYMRELGEGMKRMFRLMEENELGAPKLHTDQNSFTVVLANKSVFSDREEQWLELFRDFPLTPLQKRIVVLGSQNRDISQKDIYQAMNTEDRDTYDREVTALRKSGILQQIRSNRDADGMARRDRIPKANVPRFRVVLPHREKTEDTTLGVFVANLPFDADKDELRSLFGRCGSISRIDLPHLAGKPRGFGFIWFETLEATRKAIKEFDRHELRGRPIKVDKIRPTISREEGGV